MEHHKNIKCSLKEMQALFENREYNYSIRYFEQIKEGLFKAIIRTPENIEFPKSNTISIKTLKKILEIRENVDSFYIKDEFHAMRRKISEFDKKKYPGYEDMDIKLIIAKFKGIEDFNTLNDIYEKLEGQDLLDKLKMDMKEIVMLAVQFAEHLKVPVESKKSVIQQLKQNQKMVAKSSDYNENHIKNKEIER